MIGALRNMQTGFGDALSGNLGPYMGDAKHGIFVPHIKMEDGSFVPGHTYRQYGPNVGRMSKTGIVGVRAKGEGIFALAEDGKSFSKMSTGKASLFPTGLGLAGTAIGLGFGYAEGGMTGLMDAAFIEGSAQHFTRERAFTRAEATTIDGRKGMTIKARGGMATLGIGAGSYIGAAFGAEIGRSVLGAPGAAYGSYAGAFVGSGIAARSGLGLIAAGVAGAGYMAQKGLTTVVKASYQRGRAMSSIDTAGSTAQFFTQNANTMRSRAISAMHRSHINARSALGQEATYLSNTHKNYFSSYRR